MKLLGRRIKSALAPGIQREQSIIPHLPGRGMARILGMIKNGDTDNLAIHGTVIIAPIRGFAPGRAIAHALAVDDVSLRALDAHRFGHAYRHRALLRVPQREAAVRRMNGHLKVKQPASGHIIDAEHPVIRANHLAVGRDPIIL